MAFENIWSLSLSKGIKASPLSFSRPFCFQQKGAKRREGFVSPSTSSGTIMAYYMQVSL